MVTQSEQLYLIDSHCHLDMRQFDEDRAAVIARAEAASVRKIINPGIDLDHSLAALRLAERSPALLAAVGFHPNSSDRFTEAAEAELRRLSAHERVVAIGEIGLDYYWDKVAKEQQQAVFRRQLDLAAEVGLPVILHSRESNQDLAEIVAAWVNSRSFQQSKLAQRPYAGVLHAFSGDLALAQAAYTWNFVIGLGGPVTFKNAHNLHQLLPQLELSRLMLETDAPFLAPHPYRGKRNEPAYLALVVEKMSELLGCSSVEIIRQTTRVAERFFGLA